MPCTNVAKKKELISRKQIAGQKVKNSPILPRNSMSSDKECPKLERSEKVACHFPRAMADCLARRPKIARTYNVSNRIGFCIPRLSTTWPRHSLLRRGLPPLRWVETRGDWEEGKIKARVLPFSLFSAPVPIFLFHSCLLTGASAEERDLGTATCTFAESSLVFVRTRIIGDTSFGPAHYEQWNFLPELQN